MYKPEFTWMGLSDTVGNWSGCRGQQNNFMVLTFLAINSDLVSFIVLLCFYVVFTLDGLLFLTCR